MNGQRMCCGLRNGSTLPIRRCPLLLKARLRGSFSHKIATAWNSRESDYRRASVWIAAADASDTFHQPSRALLRKVVADGIAVIQPAFGRPEVACALARRLRDGMLGQQLTESLMDRVVASELAMDAPFLRVDRLDRHQPVPPRCRCTIRCCGPSEWGVSSFHGTKNTLSALVASALPIGWRKGLEASQFARRSECQERTQTRCVRWMDFFFHTGSVFAPDGEMTKKPADRIFKVAIVGGGFAGVYCARELLKRTVGVAEMTVAIIASENHMVFQPMLPEVAGGSLSPQHVVNPIRMICQGAEVFKRGGETHRPGESGADAGWRQLHTRM